MDFFLCILLEGMLPLSLFLFSVSFWSSVLLIVVCGCGCGCGCGCVRIYYFLSSLGAWGLFAWVDGEDKDLMLPGAECNVSQWICFVFDLYCIC